MKKQIRHDTLFLGHLSKFHNITDDEIEKDGKYQMWVRC